MAYGAAAKKKAPPDLAVLLDVEPSGKGGDMPMDDEEPSEDDELPPGFQTAAEEMAAAEQGSSEWTQAFYQAILACKKADG